MKSLMEEILHQLIWRIPPLSLQGFVHLNWRRISSINSFRTASFSVNLSSVFEFKFQHAHQKAGFNIKSVQISTSVAGLESTILK